MDDLLADFLTETSEGLVALDSALVRLERNPNDKATLSEVFRTVHTVKGTCGFLGLSRLEAVAHAGENVLGRYRDGTLTITPAGISLILSAVDRIRLIVTGLEARGEEPAGDDTAIISRLNAAAEGLPEGTVLAPSAALNAARAAAAAVHFDSLGHEPEAATPPPEVMAPPMPQDATTPDATTPDATTPDATVPELASAEAASSATQTTIRVAVDVLEGLMTLVSELVLTRNQLLQLARIEDSQAFAVPLQRLSHITSELQEGVMKTRMQPIGNAWAKLPRLVRDLSHDLGKKIELEMKGAETELDRQVLELIKDPLTHMVRNSGDHGLEGPADRRAAGKGEAGRIMLNAYHEGGHIIIEVADDGRGLPVAKIRAKVVKQGMATEAEVAGMSERDIQRFIFRPGFSTAAQVTAVSGRGVGMDVVKTNIERIGGTIEVRSQEGKGTTFVIKIPLTLAIVSALIVGCGGERFAVPQIGVVELVRCGGQQGGPQLERIKDAPVLRLRDKLLPLVSLSHLLRLDDAAPGDAGFVVVTQVGANVFGIIVDRVFDTEEIVVKPVARILRDVTMFSGNTILGDGSVIMILDPNGIARASGVGGDGNTENDRDAEHGATQGAPKKTSLLLFHAGGGAPKAVPLGLVARLENVERQRIEIVGGKPLVQYRGRLMPLIPLDPAWTPDLAKERQPVLVFSDGERSMGVVVDEILDEVSEHLTIDPTGERPGFLGTTVINERITEIIDTAWWLREAGEDWFGTPASQRGAVKKRVLLVEDSSFFRNLVVPTLTAAGYDVTAVAHGREALELRDGGAQFNIVVSDIEMPEIDGLALARNLRAGGAWQNLPLIALTGHSRPADIEAGRAAGFTDYVLKSDHETLLLSLRQCLSVPVLG